MLLSFYFLFSLNHYITCTSSICSFWLYFWQHFQTFSICDILFCLLMKRRQNYRWLNIKTQKNSWPLTLSAFDLRYSQIYMYLLQIIITEFVEFSDSFPIKILYLLFSDIVWWNSPIIYETTTAFELQEE
jgi:hypothetical protein